jgi:hypothetical protein
MSPLAIQKAVAVVQKLWTMRLPCGSPRKTKNEFEAGSMIVE